MLIGSLCLLARTAPPVTRTHRQRAVNNSQPSSPPPSLLPPPPALRAVLVDEASMLDLQMFAALLRALPPACQLILVGDPNQLPPVGPGHVLASLLNVKACSTAAAATTSSVPLQATSAVAAAADSKRRATAAGAEAASSSLAAATDGAAVAGATSAEGGVWGLLPRVHLGEVFRQSGSGSIVQSALQIMRGEVADGVREVTDGVCEVRDEVREMGDGVREMMGCLR